jgi:hypothetical protein
MCCAPVREEHKRCVWACRAHRARAADKLRDYLTLTSSPAFKPRLEASVLAGFFVVETGDVLNSVVHFWEYDSLDHRSAVRAALANSPGFLSYFSQIQPWWVIASECDEDGCESGQS